MDGSGDQILAGARFTCEQYRHVRVRRLSYLAVYINHLRRTTHHFLKGGFAGLGFQEEIGRILGLMQNRSIDEHLQFTVGYG